MHHDVSLFLELVILEYSPLNPSPPYPTLSAPGKSHLIQAILVGTERDP